MRTNGSLIPAPQEPATRVAASRRFGNQVVENAKIAGEWTRIAGTPGDTLNLLNSETLGAIRKAEEGRVPAVGVKPTAAGAEVTAVPNPDATDGRWDPFRWMPRFAFDPREDALPVDPTFDGDDETGNNGPAEANGPPGSYEDGVVGGRQPLSGGFAVTKKGPYTVLTYHFYYAHNKAGRYHLGDYSVAQVYLKPGEAGRLAPQYLYTSWHRGGQLTRWGDLEKDAAGRPVVEVELGSHALRAVPRGEAPPEGGLQIGGDGAATLDGKPTPHRLHLDTFQGNVANARKLDPADEMSWPRLTIMEWGWVGLDPLMPEVFKGEGPFKELADKARGLAAGLLEKVRGGAEGGK